jgi:WD40 repeat protein
VSYFFAAYDSGQTEEHEPFPFSARNLIAGWSTHLGTPLLHDGPVFAVAFSPDGKTVLTGSADNTARLWDVTSLTD